MIIKNIKYRVNADPRGKITTGLKVFNAEKNKELPTSTDYFVVSDFNELVMAYGEKPTKLILFFPSDTIEDFYSSEYSLYGSNQKKIRTCDGVKCIHRISEVIGKDTFEAGESECICESYDVEKKKRCNYVMQLKAFICLPSGNVENPNCYFFETHSKNSGDNIYSEIERIKSIFGTLRNIPFELSVKMCNSNSNAFSKFPIWNLRAIGMVSEIRGFQTGNILTGKDSLQKLIGGNNYVQNILNEIKLCSSLDEIKNLFESATLYAKDGKISNVELNEIKNACTERKGKVSK